MQNLINDIVIAVGGGSFVAIAMLTIFKKAFLKIFEASIESTFEKNLEKYRHRLSRSTSAYEILLEREMRFYEMIDPVYAELIPLEHDLLYYLKSHPEVDCEVLCTAFKECCERYTYQIKNLKNQTLVHQSYIPKDVFSATLSVVTQMQADLVYWTEMAKLLFSNQHDEIDYERGDEIVKVLLMKIAVSEMAVKERLKELAEL